jgi:predicted  nucleic acid-binding Zn-ribbon protein
MQIDFASIVALTLLVAVVSMAWLNRRQSPGVDRAIAQEMGKIKNRVAKVEAQLGGCATREDIAALTGKIEALEEYSASSGEIIALEGKINTLGERVEAVRETAKETRDAVKVIERLLMKGRLD